LFLEIFGFSFKGITSGILFYCKKKKKEEEKKIIIVLIEEYN
jgi:hypothetical protein